MKKKYEAPEIDFFDVEDVITTSGDESGYGNNKD